MVTLNDTRFVSEPMNLPGIISGSKNKDQQKKNDKEPVEFNSITGFSMKSPAVL